MEPVTTVQTPVGNRLLLVITCMFAAIALLSGALNAALAVKDPDGKAVRIEFTGTDKPTLLYVFTPGCIWCGRNLENFSDCGAGGSALPSGWAIADSRQGSAVSRRQRAQVPDLRSTGHRGEPDLSTDGPGR